MIRSYKLFLILFIAVGQSMASHTEATEAKGKPLFIKGGTLYTITRGVIPNGEILIQDGRIQKIGHNLFRPKDAVILDAEGKWVMPGFVIVQSAAISMHPFIREDNNPKFANYLDPFGLELQLLLASGITTFSPNLGVISPFGQERQKSYSFKNAVIKPIYGKLEAMLVKEPAYLYISIPDMIPSEKNELRDFLIRARDFISKEMDYEKSKDLKKAQPPAVPPDLKNYVSVLKQELPVRFYADRKKDLLKALSFVDEFGMRAQIFGAGEGWLVAEEIGKRNISTIIQPEAFLRSDLYQPQPGGSNIKNAALQNEKGIPFALVNPYTSVSTGGMIGNDLLTFPLAGAYAIRGGLDPSQALKAITIRPAEMLGIGHRVGSLEEGKDADIIILDGNPFDYRTFVEYTVLDGQLMYDKSKSTLYQKIPKPKRLF